MVSLLNHTLKYEEIGRISAFLKVPRYYIITLHLVIVLITAILYH